MCDFWGAKEMERNFNGHWVSPSNQESLNGRDLQREPMYRVKEGTQLVVGCSGAKPGVTALVQGELSHWELVKNFY